MASTARSTPAGSSIERFRRAAGGQRPLQATHVMRRIDGRPIRVQLDALPAGVLLVRLSDISAPTDQNRPWASRLPVELPDGAWLTHGRVDGWPQDIWLPYGLRVALEGGARLAEVVGERLQRQAMYLAPGEGERILVETDRLVAAALAVHGGAVIARLLDRLDPAVHAELSGRLQMSLIARARTDGLVRRAVARHAGSWERRGPRARRRLDSVARQA